MKHILLLLILCVLGACKTTQEVTDALPDQPDKVDRLTQQLSEKYKEAIWDDAVSYPLLDQGTYIGMYKHIQNVISKTIPTERISEDQEIWIVAHDDQRHAWLLPNGDFYITSGLLKLIKSEDELAAVASWTYASEELCPQWQAQVDMYTRDVVRKCCSERSELYDLLYNYVYTTRTCIADSLLLLSSEMLCNSVYGNDYTDLRERLHKTTSEMSTFYPIAGEISTQCTTSVEKDRYKYARGFLNRKPYRICNGAGADVLIPEEVDRGQLRHSSSTPRG